MVISRFDEKSGMQSQDLSFYFSSSIKTLTIPIEVLMLGLCISLKTVMKPPSSSNFFWRNVNDILGFSNSTFKVAKPCFKLFTAHSLQSNTGYLFLIYKKSCHLSTSIFCINCYRKLFLIFCFFTKHFKSFIFF